MTTRYVEREVYLLAISRPHIGVGPEGGYKDWWDAIYEIIPEDAQKAIDVDYDHPDAIMEFAGRTCYDAYGRKNAATAENADYLANILDQGHLSVLEHSSFTFLLRNVSRSATHEIVRHRHFGFCLSGDTEVYLDRPRLAGDGKRGPSQTRTLKQLWEMWQDRRRTYVKTMTIRSVSPEGHIVHQHVKNVFLSGEKVVYEVETENGYKVKASKDHLFMVDPSSDSFQKLEDLSVGDEITVNGRSVELDDEWLKTKVEEGLSTPQIAQLAQCSTSFIKKRRAKLGISAALGSGTVGFTPWNKGKTGYNLPKWSDESKEAFKERIKDHPHWEFKPEDWKRGHNVSNRLFPWMRELGCRMCGDKEGRIELDHIDNNPLNNDESNIQPLCVPCHKAKTSGTPPKKTYQSKIVRIEKVGVEETYDLEMDGYHNFVANGMVVHNSQESQRFVHGRKRDIVLPPAVTELDDGQLDAIDAAFDENEYTYKMLKAKGLTHKEASEAARMFLPNAAATNIVVTGNARSWKEFVEKRLAPGADAELQGIAQDILNILEKVNPGVFSEKQRKHWDGKEIQHGTQGVS